MIGILIPAIIIYFLMQSGEEKKYPTPPDPIKPSDPVFPDPPLPPVNFDPIKDRFDITIKKFADGYGIPWQIIKAHLAVESDYGTTTQVMERKLGVGNKRGIMGITEATFNAVNKMIKGSFRPDDLWKPEVSLEIATALIKSNTMAIAKNANFYKQDYYEMSELDKKLQQENLIRIVMAYNAGVGAVQKGTYSQTTKDYFNKWTSAFKEITERQGAI